MIKHNHPSIVRAGLKPALLAVILLALLSSVMAGFVTPAYADEADYVSDQVIVKLQPGVSIADINADYGTTTVDTGLAGRRIYLLHTDEDPMQTVSDMQSDPRIVFAEVNYYSNTPEANPRGTYAWGGQNSAPLATQYAGDLIALAPAQQLAQGAGVTVAVIDTGVQIDHPYLGGVLVAGYDFVDDDANPGDIASGSDADGDSLIDEAYGHGTHVAGIVRYVAPAAGIMSLRVLNSDGVGTSFQVAEAIDFAIANGADVINLSLGSISASQAMQEVLDSAEAQGIVVAAAAGNLGSEEYQYPAAFAQVLAITSVDEQRVKAESASFGAWVDLAAPGEGIYSSYPIDGYAWWSGTSMATPFVSGLAALAISSPGARSSALIRDALTQNAVPIDAYNGNYQGKLGHGLIDAGATVQSLFPPTAVVLSTQTADAAPTLWPLLLLALLIGATLHTALARRVAV